LTTSLVLLLYGAVYGELRTDATDSGLTPRSNVAQYTVPGTTLYDASRRTRFRVVTGRNAMKTSADVELTTTVTLKMDGVTELTAPGARPNVGFDVGSLVGRLVGCPVGCRDGRDVGCVVGCRLGWPVGCRVG
jgi:hypothetical protein